MKANHIKLNDDKTELLVITSPHFQGRVVNSKITVSSDTVRSSHSAHDLGIILDSTLSMEKQVSSICKSAYYHLCININGIRNSLDFKTTETLIHAFVTSWLDSGNAVLAGLPKKLIAKLQTVQNSAAREVLETKRYDYITPALQSLHWLPVQQCINYKSLLLTWKAFHGQAPGYISELVIPYILPLVLYTPKVLISWSSLASSPIAMAVLPFPDLHPDCGIPCHMICGNVVH
ncbi:hypothetical protein HOLleu_05600 [Holothuria leucospilota]|uniref:Reverse transcriptase domain-containing protein n=1 Tax=Holothuria leucospilota TaxID=206669 RepID=A0A9Q1CKX6_HOLLE|nr:hypothetical protein HOLleu_05600 [Holothuria leucospilota]